MSFHERIRNEASVTGRIFFQLLFWAIESCRAACFSQFLSMASLHTSKHDCAE